MPAPAMTRFGDVGRRTFPKGAEPVPLPVFTTDNADGLFCPVGFGSHLDHRPQKMSFAPPGADILHARAFCGTKVVSGRNRFPSLCLFL